MFGSLLEYSVILLHLKIYSLSLALPNSSGTMMNTQALMSAALPATNAMSGNGTTGTVNHHRMETGPSHKSCFQREGFFHSRRGWYHIVNMPFGNCKSFLRRDFFHSMGFHLTVVD